MLRKLIFVVALGACLSGALVPECFGQTARQKAAGKGAQQKAARYVCPMHPEVVSTKPGTCPKCEMALRLVRDDAPAAATPTEPPASDAAPTAMTGSKGVEETTPRVPDTLVLDQQGKPLKFYTDLVKGRTVAINFIFTTCTTICPPLTATFRKVQQTLGDRVGRDVQLISVSVDPTTDTPERLLAFSEKFKAAPGWTFVTGNKSEIDSLLKTFAVAVADKNDHTPMILIINDQTKKWTRTYGLAPASTLSRMITETADAK